MPLLIHIDVPLPNIDLIRPQVEQCCQEVGDRLIGHRIYEDVGEVLLVACLSHDEHFIHHIKLLNAAFHRHLILSFQSEHTNLIRVSCPPPGDIRSIMRGFPLLDSDSWFPAIDDGQIAYVSTHGILLKTGQEQWMEEQGLDYHYV
jgi:hypothetical protein